MEADSTFFLRFLLQNLDFQWIALPLQPASLIRPAPAELPQDRNVARVGG